MSVNQIFVNLPVADIATSKAFYEALGFAHNADFSDDDSAYIVVSEHIALQLASHKKFDAFTPAPIPASGGVVLVFGTESRDEVDKLVDTALLSGGAPTKDTTDLGWLYNRGFADPDGHHFEAVYLDMGAAAT